MSLKFDTVQAIKVALASESAANDLITSLNTDVAAQAIGASASPTFVGLTLTGNETVAGTMAVTGDSTIGGNLTLATGKVLKVGVHQVVGAQQAAVVPVAVTFSASAPSTYASPTGLLTVSNGGTPTVSELLAYCDELRANIVSLQAVLHAHGLTS